MVNFDLSDNDLLSNKNHGQAVHECSYYQDYIGFVIIHTFDDTGAETHSVVLNRDHPVFLGDVQMHWAENNQFMRIPVSFTFDSWYIGGMPAAQRRNQLPAPQQTAFGIVGDGESFE